MDIKTIADKTKGLRLLRIFSNSDLRCGHLGLRAIAMEHEIDPWALKPGDFLVFLNSTKTKIKMYTPGNGIFSWQHPERRRIDLNLIRYIPRFFNGTEFQEDKAYRELLKVSLKKAA